MNYEIEGDCTPRVCRGGAAGGSRERMADILPEVKHRAHVKGHLPPSPAL